MSTPSSSITLTNLPPELPLYICEFLSSADVYSLAFTCSDLHQLALPVFLARYDCGPRGDFIFDSVVAPDVVKALRSALFRPKLHRLTYAVERYAAPLLPTVDQAIPTPDNTADVTQDQVERDDYHDGLPALRELLRVGIGIEDVLVHLGDISNPNPKLPEAKSQLEIANDTTDANGDKSDPTQCSLMQTVERSDSGKAWVETLDAFMYQSRCRSLTVEMVGPRRVSSSIQKIETAIARYRYELTRILLKASLAWGGTLLDMAAKRIGLGSDARVTHLGVHSTALFFPSLLRWTFEKLSAPTLTSVSFDHLQHFTPHTWSLLLPCVKVPNLQQLSINMCAIRTEDLYAFLGRHSKIQELKLGRSLLKPDPKVSLPESKPYAANWNMAGFCLLARSPPASVSRATGDRFLPSLHTLTSFPDYIVAFLSSPSTHPFPKLRTVRVCYKDRKATAHTLDAINHELAPVCLRLRKVQEVVLNLTFEANGASWKMGQGGHGSHGNDSAGLGADGMLSSRRYHDQGLEEDHCQQQPSTSVSFVASCVTKVELEMKVFLLPLSIVFSLPKWLGNFPRMKGFSLKTLAAGVRPVELADPEVEGEFPTVIPGREAKQRAVEKREAARRLFNIDTVAFQVEHFTSVFLHSVVKNCPGVGSVELDGRRVEVPLPTERIARLR